MCTDLGPDFQEAEHARLLPGLMAVMDNFNHPRIQAHAAAAVVNFSENCEQVQLAALDPVQRVVFHACCVTVRHLKICNMSRFASHTNAL